MDHSKTGNSAVAHSTTNEPQASDYLNGFHFAIPTNHELYYAEAGNRTILQNSRPL